MEITFFVLCFNAGIAVICILIAWPKKKIPSVVPLMFFNGAVIFWSVGYAFELISPLLVDKFAWTVFQYVGIILIPIPSFLLSIEHLQKRKFSSPFPVFLLLIIPLFIFVMLITNDLHHLFYEKIELIIKMPYNGLNLHYGVFFWIQTLNSCVLFVGSMLLLLRSLFILPSVYKRQTILILFAYVLPWIANLVYILRIIPSLEIDPRPIGFAASGVIVLFGLLYYNLFDFIPIAADIIINNLNDSIIVLSPDNKVLKINPQAEKLLSCDTIDCIGKDISTLSHGIFTSFTQMTFGKKNHMEIELTPGNETYYFDCKISPIKMGKRLVAKSVMLRDITLLKKAQLDLENWNSELENTILKRTSELSSANDHLKKEICKKETLLTEIHHRIKNNLAIIKSLIFIQSSNIDDPDIQDMFRDLTSRVASIGLIYEKLYTSEDFQTIDLDNYLSGLLKSHIATFCNNDRPIRLKKEIDELSLNIDTIIPLGLIFTELITNSIKYAKNEEGEFIFKIKAKGDMRSICFIFSDSGCGYPESVLQGERKSTGLKLIEVFVEQVNGSIVFENDNGAKTSLTIPIE